MTRRCSSTGLARIDVLAAVFLGCLLILLVPVLFAKPREQSMRRLCAANLAQIGKAMLIYANDYEDDLPRAGGRTTVWRATPNWKATDRRAAFWLSADGSGGTASITASFYLLVKYYGLPVRLFVCKADKGTTEFKLPEHMDVPISFQLDDAWDFGGLDESYKHCSYAYHIPYGLYSLSTSNDPNMAVAADRNPWIRSPAADPADFTVFRPGREVIGGLGTSDQACRGNSITHQRDAQNVLFLDGRVSFQKRAYCAMGKDNIYTISRMAIEGDPWGILPVPGPVCSPANRKDSLLVHDPGPLVSDERR